VLFIVFEECNCKLIAEKFNFIVFIEDVRCNLHNSSLDTAFEEYHWRSKTCGQADRSLNRQIGSRQASRYTDCRKKCRRKRWGTDGRWQTGKDTRKPVVEPNGQARRYTTSYLEHAITACLQKKAWGTQLVGAARGHAQTERYGRQTDEQPGRKTPRTRVCFIASLAGVVSALSFEMGFLFGKWRLGSRCEYCVTARKKRRGGGGGGQLPHFLSGSRV